MTNVEWYETANEADQKFEAKKMQLLMSSLFFVTAFFLAQSVVFEAAVPFSVPFWAIVRKKYRKYATAVLVGSMIGCFFLKLWTSSYFSASNRLV